MTGSSFSTRPAPSSATNAALPSGAKTRPYGCDPYGRAIVRRTSNVDRIEDADASQLVRFVTQTSPFGANASARGAVPTAISASFWLFAVLNTLTVSLSWFTTHRRPPRNAIWPETTGGAAVSGRCTSCENVRRLLDAARSSVAVTLTQNIDGRVNVCVTVGDDDQPVSVPSSKNHLNCGLIAFWTVAV